MFKPELPRFWIVTATGPTVWPVGTFPKLTGCGLTLIFVTPVPGRLTVADGVFNALLVTMKLEFCVPRLVGENDAVNVALPVEGMTSGNEGRPLKENSAPGLLIALTVTGASPLLISVIVRFVVCVTATDVKSTEEGTTSIFGPDNNPASMFL